MQIGVRKGGAEEGDETFFSLSNEEQGENFFF
jgi:hypothetical protein